jgi:hypothetical protein
VRALVLVAAVAFFAGCGETTSQELPLLPSSALPGLSSSTESVSADDLAADFGAGANPVSGLVDGRERVFQGESHDLDRVVSRTLEFEDAESAQAYVSYFHSHLADAYGPGTTASPIESKAREGYLIDPAACACHRAEPTMTALVSDGSRVTYLEINGGAAKRDKLETLLAQAP